MALELSTPDSVLESTNVQEPVIIQRIGSAGDGQLYRLCLDGGQLLSIHRQRGDYQIDKIEVDSDKRRLGKAGVLLEASRNHAHELGAHMVTAAITSRACLSAMNRVFGEEHIDIALKGQFSDSIDENTVDTTRAYLLLDLNAQ